MYRKYIEISCKDSLYSCQILVTREDIRKFFEKIPTFKISRKPVLWEPNYFTRTHKQT
jgi:hypothetical protein